MKLQTFYTNRLKNYLTIKNMEVKIKKTHKDAVIPQYAHKGDAALDVTATSFHIDTDGNFVYGIGLAFDIPEGYYMQVLPRSSNAKKDLILSNGIGTIDSSYKGEVIFKFKPSTRMKGSLHIIPGMVKHYAIGDRIGQIIILPYPTIEFVEVDELSDSERGTGSYGSTGV